MPQANEPPNAVPNVAGQTEACSRRAAEKCSVLGRSRTYRGHHAHALGLRPGKRGAVGEKSRCSEDRAGGRA